MNWWDWLPLVNTVALVVLTWIVVDRRHVMDDINSLRERVARLEQRMDNGG